MRYILVAVTIVAALVLNSATVMAASSVDIFAKAGCLIDAATKKILYQKNADMRMYPASTTKIVTLVVALKNGDLNSIVTVDEDAAGCEGSSLDLKAGDKLTLHNLLYGMMLVSGNDAAEAVAVHVGGSREAFIKLMNEEACKSGALNTNFTNPHGLPDDNHYTTARDLALITAYAYDVPGFADIVGSSHKTIEFIDGQRYIVNTNKLLASYQGANGVKTGYTSAAGYCLVAAAKRGEVQLVAVILNSDKRYYDAEQLLDYGFKIIKEKNTSPAV